MERMKTDEKEQKYEVMEERHKENRLKSERVKTLGDEQKIWKSHQGQYTCVKHVHVHVYVCTVYNVLTSNTYSLVSSGLCVTPLSSTLSITTERRADCFTDD